MVGVSAGWWKGGESRGSEVVHLGVRCQVLRCLNEAGSEDERAVWWGDRPPHTLAFPPPRPLFLVLFTPSMERVSVPFLCTWPHSILTPESLNLEPEARDLK